MLAIGTEGGKIMEGNHLEVPACILVADRTLTERSILLQGFHPQHICLTGLQLISSFRTALYNALFLKAGR